MTKSTAARSITRPRGSASRRGSTREVSQKAIERLALYRRILRRAEGREKIYSHEIAGICGATPAQVRRDLMAVGFLGHPVHGYDIAGLLPCLDAFLGTASGTRMALVGIGNLGRALLSYFNAGRSGMEIAIAFDSDPSRVNRTINGCHAYPIDELPIRLPEARVDVAVIAVPSAAAQEVADLLVASGIRSLVNLAAVRLQIPETVFVEDVDLGIAIEKALFYARSKRNQR